MATVFLPISLLLILVSVGVCAVNLGKLQEAVKRVDPDLYSSIALDRLSIVRAHSGEHPAQKFVFRKEYLRHSDPIIRKLGERYYKSVILFVASFLLLILVTIVDAVAT
ncbi:MAG: hypothetical protein AAGC71_01715 [Pseudomonadota bacterium]